MEQTDRVLGVQADGGGADRSPIALLQEYVQSSKGLPLPTRRRILQWNFEARDADFAGREFRATVAFLLDGLPHHIVGSWQRSKKLAQRDAAERTLGLLIGRWGSHLLQPNEGTRDEADRSCASDTSCGSSSNAADGFGRQLPSCVTSPIGWMLHWDKEGDLCRAIVQVELLGVPHQFAGKYCEKEQEARADVARGLLWYLQVAGFEELVEINAEAATSCLQDIPLPPANWVSASETTRASAH
uniref:Uncharacterized protein n=1 Tax=Noctiluca scintillans TaxID=2966 RepID=A0A7S0ZY30_NOCSC